MSEQHDQNSPPVGVDDEMTGGPHDFGGPDPIDPDPDLMEAEEPEIDVPFFEDSPAMDGDVDTDIQVETGGMPIEERIERLEHSIQELAAADAEREAARVRRKVVASTTGAGTVGLVPALLQLAGVYDLSPELTATISTAAAAGGALVLGYLTPERKAPPTPQAADELLYLADR